MKNDIAADLLDKYLKGNCTPAEEKQVLEWYNSFDGNTDWITAASELRRQEIKKRIYNAITENTEGLVNTEPVNKSKIHTLIYTLSGIAAILLICSGLYFLHKTPVENNLPATNVIAITNNTKTIHEETLSDGTHVWLSPGAQIKYSKFFTGNTRTVAMTGESFFEVTKNPAKPFIINSGKIITKVWGTSFRVRSLKGIDDVAVITGKVSVKLTDPGKKTAAVNEVMIYPNQQVVYLSDRNTLKTGNTAAVKGLKIWHKVNLSFDNTGLNEVMTVLNKSFDINITTNDAIIKTYTLNADFNGLNLPEIMEILHKTLNIDYEINGAEISLKRN